MFVQTGAKGKIIEERKKNFYETFVKKIITEAKLIGIDKQELKKMIDQGNEE